MKIACAKAIAKLAHQEISDVVASAYIGEDLKFGRDYLIPKPFDLRLITEIATAVASAAIKSGVATKPIHDMAQYKKTLSQFAYKSNTIMRPVF